MFLLLELAAQSDFSRRSVDAGRIDHAPNPRQSLTTIFHGCYRHNHFMRQRIEYLGVWLLVRTLGALPRPLARAAGSFISSVTYLLHSRLRRVGQKNLQMA